MPAPLLVPRWRPGHDAVREPRPLRCISAIRIVFLVVSALVAADSAIGQSPRLDAGGRAERRAFSDAEITQGFLKLAFGAEASLRAPTDRVRKFDQPVRVFIENRARRDRSRQVADIVADIRARTKDLDIAVIGERADANVVVKLVRDRDLARAMREVYGRENARRIRRAHDPQCLAGYSKDETFRILRADVILVVDVGEFTFRDCAYEEILQALGPINDDGSVPWSMFNDDVSLGYYGVYDQYLMNILYDPRVRAGMTREDVRALLPSVLPDVRAFVARNNDLPR
jgi:hypothetical protein